MVIGMVVLVEEERHHPDGDRRTEWGWIQPGKRRVDCISVILFQCILFVKGGVLLAACTKRRLKKGWKSHEILLVLPFYTLTGGHKQFRLSIATVVLGIALHCIIRRKTDPGISIDTDISITSSFFLWFAGLLHLVLLFLSFSM